MGDKKVVKGNPAIDKIMANHRKAMTVILDSFSVDVLKNLKKKELIEIEKQLTRVPAMLDKVTEFIGGRIDQTPPKHRTPEENERLNRRNRLNPKRKK